MTTTETTAAEGRPALVTQHSVERVIGLRARLFLRLCRELAFPSCKVARDVVAHTSDVLAYLEQRIDLRARPAANDADPEAVALARAGMRRVAQ